MANTKTKTKTKSKITKSRSKKKSIEIESPDSIQNPQSPSPISPYSSSHTLTNFNPFYSELESTNSYQTIKSLSVPSTGYTELDNLILYTIGNTLGAAHVGVYVIMRSFLHTRNDSNNGDCYPTYSTLMSLLSIKSNKTLVNIMKDLEDHNFIIPYFKVKHQKSYCFPYEMGFYTPEKLKYFIDKINKYRCEDNWTIDKSDYTEEELNEMKNATTDDLIPVAAQEEPQSQQSQQLQPQSQSQEGDDSTPRKKTTRLTNKDTTPKLEDKTPKPQFTSSGGFGNQSRHDDMAYDQAKLKKEIDKKLDKLDKAEISSHKPRSKAKESYQPKSDLANKRDSFSSLSDSELAAKKAKTTDSARAKELQAITSTESFNAPSIKLSEETSEKPLTYSEIESIINTEFEKGKANNNINDNLVRAKEALALLQKKSKPDKKQREMAEESLVYSLGLYRINFGKDLINPELLERSIEFNNTGKIIDKVRSSEEDEELESKPELDSTSESESELDIFSTVDINTDDDDDGGLTDW